MILLDRVRHVLGTGRSARRTGWWPAGLLALAIPLGLWAAATPAPSAVAEEGRDQADRKNVQVAQREEDEREEPREERREIERERPAAEREREREQDREREGEAPREGERREEERRDGDRERPEGDRDRPEGDRERPDGDRPFRIRIHGDGRAIEGEFGRRGAEMRFGGDRPRPHDNAELMRVIGELRWEVELLRREVRELRGERGELPPGPPPRRDGDRREGFGPPRPPRDRDVERRHEGERRPEGDRREGERPGPRDGERREFRGPRDGEREVPRERRDGEDAPAERPERESREE